MAPGLFSCLRRPAALPLLDCFSPRRGPGKPHLLEPSPGWTGRCAGRVVRPCSENSGKPPVRSTAAPTPEVADTVPPQETRVAGPGGQRHRLRLERVPRWAHHARRTWCSSSTPSRKNATAPARRPTQGTRGRRAEQGRWTGVAGRQARQVGGRNPTAPSRSCPSPGRGSPQETSVQNEEGQEPHVAVRALLLLSWWYLRSRSPRASEGSHATRQQGRTATEKIAP